MLRDATGRYVASLAGGETVRAFVPDPLPPVPPLDLDGARQAALEQATLALGRLDSIALLLPDPQLFLYAYVRREAVLSSQIEGTQSSLSDLLLFELDEMPGVPFDDVVEVSNYVAALEHGMARLREGFPLCNRLLREMHEHSDGARARRGQGARRVPPQSELDRRHPPRQRPLRPAATARGRTLHGGAGSASSTSETAKLPVLLKAALAHVQFETIHPFLDGNGRLGRLLIALLLHQGGAAGPAAALPQPLLQAAPRPLLRTAGPGAHQRRLGGLGRFLSRRRRANRHRRRANRPPSGGPVPTGQPTGPGGRTRRGQLSCAYSKHCASAPSPPCARSASKPASASPPPPKPC